MLVAGGKTCNGSGKGLGRAKEALSATREAVRRKSSFNAAAGVITCSNLRTPPAPRWSCYTDEGLAAASFPCVVDVGWLVAGDNTCNGLGKGLGKGLG